jgi:multidrug resistance efflux pump
MNASQKLKKLEEKREQLEARIKNIEASELTREKKEDTRRKILIGAFYMEQMEKHEDLKTKVLAFLDDFLVRPMDRKLFGLPEKPHSDNQHADQS